VSKPKQYEVIWTETAKRDLVEIIEYISTDSISSAKKIANKIRQRAQRLESLPTRGRWVPELQEIGVFIYRELIEKPWRITYRVEQDKVYITGVLDSRRDLEAILLERILR